jgi:hypothetical protein
MCPDILVSARLDKNENLYLNSFKYLENTIGRRIDKSQNDDHEKTDWIEVE